jgi:hypothetical protein
MMIDVLLDHLAERRGQFGFGINVEVASSRIRIFGECTSARATISAASSG